MIWHWDACRKAKAKAKAKAAVVVCESVRVCELCLEEEGGRLFCPVALLKLVRRINDVGDVVKSLSRSKLGGCEPRCVGSNVSSCMDESLDRLCVVELRRCVSEKWGGRTVPDSGSVSSLQAGRNVCRGSTHAARISLVCSHPQAAQRENIK